MRALLPALVLSISALFSSSGNATDRHHQIAALGNTAQLQASAPNDEKYRGYYSDVSQLAGRQDFGGMVDVLRRQLDIVESVGLKPHILAFFHTIPILMDELACANVENPKLLPAACYTEAAPQRRSFEPTLWDSKMQQWTNESSVNLAEDTHLGVVMIYPNMLVATNSQKPILLHELLHAYHHVMMPEGSKNSAILAHYKDAKGAQLYPPNSYVMTNEKEFFAVTASVFLYGKADQPPVTRSTIKQKQPELYKYFVWLFGFDPDAPPAPSPVALVD